MALTFKQVGLRGKFGWRAMLVVAALAVIAVLLFSMYSVPETPGVTRVSGVVTPGALAPGTASTPKVVTPASAPKVAARAASVPAKAEKPKKAVVEKSTKPVPPTEAGTVTAATPPPTVVADASGTITFRKRYMQREPESKPFKWVKPGGDPCKGNAKCTYEWALSESGWPMVVRAEIARKVASESPERMHIRAGDWFDFMSFGRHTARLERHVVAAWGDPARAELASFWSYEYGDVLYRFVKPDICHNWAGQTFTVVLTPVPAEPKPTPRVEAPRLTVKEVDDILGVVPVADCS